MVFDCNGVRKNAKDNMFSRKSIRLKNFDYSTPAAYFVTIRIEQCGYLFGDVIDEQMKLNVLGEKVKEYWLNIPKHYPNVLLDEYVIMPNHIHGIIMLFEPGSGVRQNAIDVVDLPCNGVRENTENTKRTSDEKFYSKLSPQKGTISVIIREFKASFTLWCRKNNYEDFKWQRNFYDRIIRNEKELFNIRGYILNNPIKWAWEKENRD